MKTQPKSGTRPKRKRRPPRERLATELKLKSQVNLLRNVLTACVMRGDGELTFAPIDIARAKAAERRMRIETGDKGELVMQLISKEALAATTGETIEPEDDVDGIR